MLEFQSHNVFISQNFVADQTNSVDADEKTHCYISSEYSLFAVLPIYEPPVYTKG